MFVDKLTYNDLHTLMQSKGFRRKGDAGGAATTAATTAAATTATAAAASTSSSSTAATAAQHSLVRAHHLTQGLHPRHTRPHSQALRGGGAGGESRGATCPRAGGFCS